MTVLGLAGTALMFADSVDDEVERWLRPLRLYGKAGATLQSLGLGDAQPEAAAQGKPERSETSAQDTLTAITAAASRFAEQQGASSVGTLDILRAVMEHYGAAFDRALTCRCIDSAELEQRLALEATPA